MSTATRLNASYLAKDITRRFESIIDLKDVERANEAQRGMALRTRGLAAFALASAVPDLSDEIAAQHVTDGSQDCGIDALYFDKTSKRVFVVQSKWHDEGTGSIGLGDMRNTIAGLEYLINEQFDRFNSKFAHIVPSIEVALGDIDVTFELIVAVTGSSTLAQEPQQAVDDLLSELNDISEFARFRVLGLSELRESLLQGQNAQRIDVDVNLINWGPFAEPYSAYFGLVSATALVAWYEQFGGALFDKNLRKALGVTSVNSSIIDTVKNSPEHFWYFNNGVTVLCERVNKPPKGGASRLVGDFHAEGISVVNGAQTVSSLAAVARENPEKLDDILVWVRLISVEGAPENFANEVTRSTNTQNSVEASDFLSLDPNQSRLREDFRLALGKEYVFRRGEVAPKRQQGTTATEALTALACAMDDSGFAVIAKSAIGRLEEREGRYYLRLITSSRTIYEIWNCVNILRIVEDKLAILRSTKTGKDRAIALQGNRIVAHLVMRELGGISGIGKVQTDNDLQELLERAKITTGRCFESLAKGVASEYPSNYITSLFKNASRCSDLVKWVLSDLGGKS